MKLGRFPESARNARELLQLSEAQDYPYGEFWACFQLGRVAEGTHDMDAAESWLGRAVQLAPKVRNSENHAAMAIGCLANVAKACGDDLKALRLAEEGLVYARECGNPFHHSWIALVAGRLHHTLGDQRQAARTLIESTEAYAEFKDSGGVRAALTELGRVALANNQPESARALLVAAHGLPAHKHDRPIHDAALADLAARLKTTPGNLVADDAAILPLDELVDLARSFTVESTELTPADAGQVPGGLTPRETDVLRLLVDGRSNRAIGEALSISERTVENHVFRLLGKLGVESRTSAMAWAVRKGFA
jgi:ATP/maltotriose-dependent transcriptional regulator MalT